MNQSKKGTLSRFSFLFVILSSMALAWAFPFVQSHAQSQGQGANVDVEFETHHDISRPLRDMQSKVEYDGAPRAIPLRIPHPAALTPQLVDPVVQSSAAASLATTSVNNFPGLGQGSYGFTVQYIPPDPNIAVGATQVVQWVNASFGVFDKSGNLSLGPVPGNTLWSGFGGGCEANNDGDPIVQYDSAADRWVMTQFSVSTTPYLQCVAVSTSGDATGSYYRYAFPMPNFPDYPKLGVWPDAYYLSFNMFSGSSFVGARVCAFDRVAMINGNTATQQCFQLSSSYGSLLPSDLDGSTSPPAGSPNYFINFGSNSLNLWKFHVDFITPANATLTGPINIKVAAFSPACNGGTCIPQANTKQKLDSLGDRLMYRLAYRNFGTYESLVVNHSVTAGGGGRKSTSSVGIRWYEIRTPGTTPTVYQQGTYAPDSNYRWMGSIAMDKVGNMAVGYSVSGSTLYPSIRYTGRVSTDPLGTLQGENSIVEGKGSEAAPYSRWGDYTSMRIDPADDCTFWYTNQYLKSSGVYWSTQIASFKFPSCQ